MVNHGLSINVVNYRLGINVVYYRRSINEAEQQGLAAGAAAAAHPAQPAPVLPLVPGPALVFRVQEFTPRGGGGAANVQASFMLG